jgi:antitoxin ParD1/3/4
MATSYSIGRHFEELIDRLLKSGRYATASEVMREGLRLVEEREDRRKAELDALRTEIQKGLVGGLAEEAQLNDWIRDIRARGQQPVARDGAE